MKKPVISFFIFHFSFFTFHLSDAQIIHVPADQPTIQAGINAATYGDTVLVANGTYLENINFNGKAITVASHFLIDSDTSHINNTVIDGSQPDDPEFGSVVSFIDGEDTTSVLCGFTITSGTGMIESIYGARIGGGIVCYNATAKIINNKIMNNQINMLGHAWGGGIAGISITGSKWTVIENNRICQNSCISESAIASAGGMEIWGNARVINNRIENNQCLSNPGIGIAGGVLATSTEDDTSLIYFRNNIVQNNIVEATLSAEGGGMVLDNVHCVITGNVFNYNTLSGIDAFGGGLLAYQIASLELIDNQISYNYISLAADNPWYGAGFYCKEPTGNLLIKTNEFSFNSGTSSGRGRGGGIYLFNGPNSETIVEGNLFIYNSCFRGGGFYEEGFYNLQIVNNLFSGNNATGDGQGRGAGIAINNPANLLNYSITSRDEFRTRIINNTFHENTADYQGGAIHYNGALSPPIIMNCIFWENEAPTGKDINNITTEIVEVSYSDIDTLSINGLWQGVGNINFNPGFLDESCHIDGSSPCYDAGTDSLEIDGMWYYAPDHDFEGSPRPFGNGIDIGADEWDGDGYGESAVGGQRLAVVCYPNPTDGIVDFRFSIGDCRWVSLRIYDLQGREVAVVLEGRWSGDQVVRWNASNLAPGVYFYQLRAEGIGQCAAGKILKH